MVLSNLDARVLIIGISVSNGMSFGGTLRTFVKKLLENLNKTKIKKEVRREVLRNLDTLSDQDFKQYLELLEHDLVRQVLKRLMVPTITPAKESAEKARDFLGQKMRKRLEELNRRKIEREITTT